MKNKSDEFIFSPQYNYGGEWVKSNNIWAKGYAFLPTGRLLKKKELAEYIEAILISNNHTEKLSALNGRFAATGVTDSVPFILTDKIRGFPLFYSHIYRQLRVSDNPVALTARNTRINKSAEIQFLASGFTWNKETLLEGIKQCPPSTLLLFPSGKIQEKTYFSYCTNKIKTTTLQEASENLKSILDNVMERALKVIGDKPIVVPLTGGFDSRFLVTWLSRKGIKNLTTFTCGIPGSSEFDNAKKVASTLGLSWYPIYHDSKTIKEVLTKDFPLSEYLNYASGATSMTYFQDILSLEKLNLPKNSVIIGGHFGGFIAGSRLLPYQNIMHPGLLINQSVKRFFPFFEGSKKDQQKLYQSIFRKVKENQPAIPYTIMEDIDFKERQSKYIANSCRTYDFYVDSTLLPYTDNELIDFFKTLPFELKLNKKLYDYTLKKFFFKEFNLLFEKELQASGSDLFRQFIKYLLPHYVIKSHLRKKETPDNHNYLEIIKHITPNQTPQKNKLLSTNQLMMNYNINYYKSIIS